TLVDAGRVNRPSVYVGESMRGGEFHGIQNAAVVPDFDAGIGPPVETVTGVAAVVERGFLLEAGASRAERELDAPLHAIRPVDVVDPDRGAAVWFVTGGE